MKGGRGNRRRGERKSRFKEEMLEKKTQGPLKNMFVGGAEIKHGWCMRNKRGKMPAKGKGFEGYIIFGRRKGRWCYSGRAVSEIGN